MLKLVIALSLVLHGIVHLLYVGQSARYFALEPGLLWPDGSWALARMLGNQSTRGLASLLLVLSAIGFVAGGAGLLAGMTWWRTMTVGAALLSSATYLLFWNGRLQNLDGQGWIGILINLAILAAILIFQWPNL